MNSLQSAQHVINLIVRQSKDKIQQNKIVKSMLIPYSSCLAENNRNDAVLHAGTQFDQSGKNFFKRQLNSEHRPVNNIKDTYSFFSVKKSKLDKKQNLQVSFSKQKSAQKTQKKLFKPTGYRSNSSYKQKRLLHNTEGSIKSNTPNQPLKDSFFMKLQEQKEKIPISMEKIDYQISSLREIKDREIQEKETQRKRQQSESEISTQRQRKLASYLQSHMSRPNNNYTYDGEGKLLLFSYDNNKNTISKAYPPTIRFQVENQENGVGFRQSKLSPKNNRNRTYSNLEFKRTERLNSKIQAAQGQIFKSSVLKTINLSRVSLGNDHIDAHQFMKRNDLFNNNHSRQTTSIPFIQIQGGAAFKQTATNQWISNKDVDTQAQSRVGKCSKSISESRPKSHDCRAIKDFKKFSSKRSSDPNCDSSIANYPAGNKIFSGTCQNFKKINSIGDSRYSSFCVQRPRTTEVGRIKRENDVLFHSMLQQDN